MATKEALSPTYDEVVDAVKARSGANVDGPKPDTPYTEGPAAGPYSDPGHVNPAIEPAPLWQPAERPPPVPVVNDPGLLGGGPSLAVLNAAARASYGVPDTDPTSGITAESQQAAIKEAATQRLQRLKSAPAEDAASGTAGKGDKIGSASKA